MIVKFKQIVEYFDNRKWIVFGLLFLAAVIISIHRYFLGPHDFWGGSYTHYNNYVIFKNSFVHLIENKNLYSHYPAEYADLFKYSPSFALAMGFFYYLPDIIGLILWNFLNIFVLYYAISSMEIVKTTKTSFVILLLVLLELILSTQNSQSNALLAGLTIISFNQFERGKNILATLFIVTGIFIKIYSGLACLLILLYPNKLKSIFALSIWTILFFALPLLVVDYSQLYHQYENWYYLLQADQSESIGMSLFTYTNLISSSNFTKSLTFIFGLLVILLPLLRLKLYANALFRINYLCIILLSMVVLNYKAESPTYIIALCGIAIWFITEKPTIIRTIFLTLALLFTSVWFTDLIPRILKTNFLDLTYLKPLFPTLILFLICFEMMFRRDLS